MMMNKHFILKKTKIYFGNIGQKSHLLKKIIQFDNPNLFIFIYLFIYRIYLYRITLFSNMLFLQMVL